MTTSEARSKIYQIFAQFFTHPDQTLWEAVNGGEISHLLSELAKELPFRTPVLEDELAWDMEGLDLEQLSILYTSNFEIGNAPIPLHERGYTKAGEAELFEELFRFYEYFGLTFDQPEALEAWPDYIGTELDFMHYLSFIDANNTGDSKSLAKAQKDFLERHLARCVEGFEKATRKKPLSLYTQLGEALNNFVIRDLEYLSRQAA